MDNENNQVTTNFPEDDAILPIGWTEDVEDIFAWATEHPEADEPKDEIPAEENGEESTDESGVPATDEETEEADAPAGETEDVPATDNVKESPNTAVFQARVNHKKVTVELPESEWPETYELAQSAKKYKAKYESVVAEQEQVELLSKLLGYASIREMLDATEAQYKDTEVNNLVNENVHPTVAKDIVDRKVNEVKGEVSKNKKPVEDQGAGDTPPERDFKPEVAELIREHPELHGKELPPDVLHDSLETGKSLLAAYEKYLRDKEKAEYARLRKENDVLKQNAEAAKRAPVKGVARGGAAETTPDDPFMKGFNLY